MKKIAIVLALFVASVASNIYANPFFVKDSVEEAKKDTRNDSGEILILPGNVKFEITSDESAAYDYIRKHMHYTYELPASQAIANLQKPKAVKVLNMEGKEVYSSEAGQRASIPAKAVLLMENKDTEFYVIYE